MNLFKGVAEWVREGNPGYKRKKELLAKKEELEMQLAADESWLGNVGSSIRSGASALDAKHVEDAPTEQRIAGRVLKIRKELEEIGKELAELAEKEN